MHSRMGGMSGTFGTSYKKKYHPLKEATPKSFIVVGQLV